MSKLVSLRKWILIVVGCIIETILTELAKRDKKREEREKKIEEKERKREEEIAAAKEEIFFLHVRLAMMNLIRRVMNDKSDKKSEGDENGKSDKESEGDEE
ncbi:hypothetical protein H5410_022842 [Solanum commersonii]|uniref:Uncharacterized protein n=1 Tax=Solanum commersonii TaxID=4109 RepID=A0A9J5ZF64_SOLCO|nr:hypothetical protein H5410_022842 [Solanum commersonii]